MKRLSYVILPLVCLSLFGSMTARPVSLTLAPAQFSIEASIAPYERHAGAYECRVNVSDLASGRVISAPTIVMPAGESADASTTVGDLTTRVSAVVKLDGKATVAVDVTRDGKTVARQRVNLSR